MAANQQEVVTLVIGIGIRFYVEGLSYRGGAVGRVLLMGFRSLLMRQGIARCMMSMEVQACICYTARSLDGEKMECGIEFPRC